MKKFVSNWLCLFVITGLLLSFASSCKNDEDTYNIQPPITGLTGYVVGDSGTILKTADSGKTWTHLGNGITNNLYSVFFIDANTGFVVGDEGHILKTFDGGLNWSELTTGTTNQLNSVYFTDVNTGYAVGGHIDFSHYPYDNIGTILKTTDGGITWNTISSDTLPYLQSVFFVNGNTGYAGGYRAAPGSQGWIGDGVILKTIDGGTTWTESSYGIWACITSVFFKDAYTGYAGGFIKGPGVLIPTQCFYYKTINSGLTWVTAELGDSNTSHVHGLNSICYADADTGYASGPRSIFKTTDAGANWTQVLSLSTTDAELSSVYFKDINNGYAVGGGGTIIKTNDGGATWTTLSSGTTVNLTSVFFIKP